jgi:hypothetical protein
MAELFERLHEQLGGGSRLIGRVTGSEYPIPTPTAPTRPIRGNPGSRSTMPLPTASRSMRGARSPGAVRHRRRPDRRGADRAGLRQDGVSYIFAGEQELDPGLALEIRNRELGIERLLLEGGGGSNGSFLRAGLIDEISLAICPAVDGAKGAPSVFDSSDKDAGIPAPIRGRRFRISLTRSGSIASAPGLAAAPSRSRSSSRTFGRSRAAAPARRRSGPAAANSKISATRCSSRSFLSPGVFGSWASRCLRSRHRSPEVSGKSARRLEPALVIRSA